MYKHWNQDVYNENMGKDYEEKSLERETTSSW